MMKKFLLAAAILFAASNALAQTSGEVANHAVPIGKGPGVIGFGAAVPGAAGTLLTSTGTTTDPSFQSLTLATIAQYYAGTGTAPIPPNIVYPAEVTLPAVSGGTLTIDFSTFINAAITLNASVTTQTLNNVVAGKDGMIVFIQPASGGPYTTVWNTIFKFPAGGLPVLSTAANAVDVLSFACRSATFCVATLLNGVHNP